MNHWIGKKDQPDPTPSKKPESADRIEALGDVAPNTCPKCQQPMELAKADEHYILICQSCRGLLIQSEVLASVISSRRRQYTGPEDTPKPMDAKELERKLSCPGCGNAMYVHPYHGPGNAVIDSCARCKFAFLDEGELAKIERAPGLRS